MLSTLCLFITFCRPYSPFSIASNKKTDILVMNLNIFGGKYTSVFNSSDEILSYFFFFLLFIKFVIKLHYLETFPATCFVSFVVEISNSHIQTVMTLFKFHTHPFFFYFFLLCVLIENILLWYNFYIL